MRSDETIDSVHGMEMTIVPSSRCFTLPDHWIVEDRRRKSGKSAGIFDRYYYEPGTGRMFRSLRSVENYLAESNEKRLLLYENENIPLSQMIGFKKKRKFPNKTKKKSVTLSTRSRASSFKLPDGWVVEKHQRKNGPTAGEVYKQYYEPETGLMFRSLKSVERYLKEPDEETPLLEMLEFGNRGKLHHKERLKIVDRSTTINISSFELLDGWTIEECIRTSGASAGRTDRYYIEPGTGLKFRSLMSVKRHLSQLDFSPTFNKSKPDNRLKFMGTEKQEFQHKRNLAIVAHDLSTSRTSNFEIADDQNQTLKEFLSSSPNCDDVLGKRQQNFGFQKDVSGPKIETLSFSSTKPPARIKWVRTDPEGDTWSPFVGESMVPDSVKQQWAQTYMLMTEVDDQHQMGLR